MRIAYPKVGDPNPKVEIGVVDDGAGAPELQVREQFSVPLPELRDAFESTLPALFSASPG